MAIVTVSGLFVAGVVPPGGGAGGTFLAGGSDEWLHALGWAAATGALVVAFAAETRPRTRAAVVALAAGVGVELVQAALPWRTFAFGDLAADAVGVGLALVALEVANRLRRVRG